MANQKNLVLVSGATGQSGGSVARALLTRGWPVRAMTRKPESEAAKALGRLGAEVVYGDLDDAASLAKALEGAWGAYAVQNTWEAGVVKEEEQGKRFADVAKKAGVRHYVQASVASAHRATAIPHFDNKWRIEEHQRGLAFPSHVVIRPVFYMENFLGPFFLPGIQQGQLVVALDPATKLQMIAVDDIGQYGAAAFERAAEWNGRAIDIAGDEHTMPEVASILSRFAGHEVKFVRAPIEEVRKFSDDYATMLEWFDGVGYDVDIAALAKETGIHPTSLTEWAGRVNWSAPVTSS
jgi:uncharacterized protein YbjT (DUF2867 family)